ncbi:MAG: NAD(P)/FAD-dependent oxidoreductase [Desulfobacteraceae bacterium]|nr:NAD(P)/FAD-dependent oxidoreductase [Desulfobacteraceae bacterium]
MDPFKGISRRSFLKILFMTGSAALVDWTELGLLASEIPDKKQFPVVVIGAGLGGLVSAAYLAKSGFPVTLIEQHSIVGGYATSFERKAGKFEFDVSLHATVAENAFPQMILSDLGVWDNLKVAYTPELRRIISSDYDIVLPAKNPEQVKKRISAVFPKEKKGIYGFYSQMEQVIDELWGESFSKRNMIKKLEKISLEDWMSMHVQTPELKKILSFFCGYYGTSPSETNALFYAIATGEYLVFGGQYYKTRSQDLSNALADAVYANNGQIVFDTQVGQILVSKKNNQNYIDGVKDSDKKVYPAKAVIANASAPAIFEKILPKNIVPESYSKKLKTHRKSLSSFVVWLGLNKEISNVKDYEIDIDIRKDAKYDKDRLYTGEYIGSGCSVTIYDNLFKGYSQPGTSTMSVMTLADYTFWEKFEKDYFKGNKNAYNRKKHQLAEILIEQVENSLIPGLKESIEVMEIGTPLTNIRYTKNPGGAIYGYDRDKEFLGSRTPVKGLYLASAWSNGGGYTSVMMAGRNAVRHLLKDFKILSKV